MNPPTILLISYHFYPSKEVGARRCTALAQFLADKGVRVVVVSAFEGAQIDPGALILPGITAIPVAQAQRSLLKALVFVKQRTVRAVAAPASPGSNTAPIHTHARLGSRLRAWFFRTLYFIDGYKGWGWRAHKAAVRAGRQYKAHILFASSPPDSVLPTGALTARRLAIPYVADLRDPWTDSVEELHPERRIELSLLRALERWTMKIASALTSTGANIANVLAARYPDVRAKIHVVRNGYDGQYQHASSDTGGRLAILFAGELYAGRDPFPVLCALERVLARPDVDPGRVSVTFMGKADSYAGQSVADWLRGKRCAANFTILPQQPPAEVAKAIAASTVLLNLAQQQHLSVPAKTYEHMASGRENLLICEDDSETAQITVGIRGINQVDQRNAPELDESLLDLYRRHVVERSLTAPSAEDVARFSRAAANMQFWTLFESLAGWREEEKRS